MIAFQTHGSARLGSKPMFLSVKSKNFTHPNFEKYFISDLLSGVRKKRTP